MTRPFTEWLKLQLLAVRIREEIDVLLGEALLEANNGNDPVAWGRVHDRLNVLGDFTGADRIRELFAGEE